MIPTINLANSLTAGQQGVAVPLVPATWDSASKTANITLSNGDLTAASDAGSTYEAVKSNRNNINTDNGGKFYWEVLVDSATGGDLYVGLIESTVSLVSNTWFTTQGGDYLAWRNNGSHFRSGWVDGANSNVSYTTGDVLMFAIDIPAGKFWHGLNGTWDSAGDPAAGTTEQFNTMPSSTDFAFIMSTDNNGGANQLTLRSDPDDFTESVPSGFTPGFAES